LMNARLPIFEAQIGGAMIRAEVFAIIPEGPFAQARLHGGDRLGHGHARTDVWRLPVAAGVHLKALEVTGRHHVIIVVGVHYESQAELLLIIEAIDDVALVFSFAKSGQQHGGQDGTDGNDDKQLKETEISRWG